MENNKNYIEYITKNSVLFGVLKKHIQERIHEDKSYEYGNNEWYADQELKHLILFIKGIEKTYEEFTRTKDVEEESPNGSR